MITKKAFTLIELLVVVAIIGLLVSILLPSLQTARGRARTLKCTAHVKSIGTAMFVYAGDNRGQLPTAAHAPNVAAAPQTVYVGQLGGTAMLPRDVRSSDRPVGAGGTTALSTTRSLWLLVSSGATVPKNFLCPASEDTPDPTVDVTTYHDFIGWGTVSYGYQIPYDRQNPSLPGAGVDPRMAILADRGPWSGIGAERAQPRTAGGVQYFVDGLNPDRTRLLARLVAANCAGALGHCTEDVAPQWWRPFNSPNHGGANQGVGQSVLYPDGHGTFLTRPTAGVDGDNLYMRMDYTQASGGDFGRALWWGEPPGHLTYPGVDSLGAGAHASTDSLIWP